MEDAYLKITGASHIDDLLSWRDENSEETVSKGKKSRRSKKKGIKKR
ncbi:unnamed protein product [marine sediment metagenome]|uniref:Uncharacterized protein n=1 Tax=marine sediment metagenome TaxID=412755 RepID=X1B3D1_9ZZZZ